MKIQTNLTKIVNYVYKKYKNKYNISINIIC